MRKLTWLVFVILLSASMVWATTPAFDATSNGTGTDDFSFNHTTGCTNCEMVVITCVSTGGGTSVSGVTYNSVALTEIAPSGGVFINTIRGQMWRLDAPASGTHSVAVAVTAANIASAAAVTYSNVNQSSPVGTPQTGSGTSSVPSISVTSAAGELVVDGVCTSDNITLAVGAGQTKRGGLATASASNGMSEETGAASVTMSWTDTLADWVSYGIALKPTSSSSTNGWWFFSQGVQ